MQDGVRATVSRLGDLTRRASHPTLIALICAGAFAPVAAAGAGALGAAIASVIGGVGGGVLTNVLAAATNRLRPGSSVGTDAVRPDSETDAVEALAEQLDEALAAGTEESEHLREELSQAIAGLRADDIAIRSAIAAGDKELLTRITAELQAFTGTALDALREVQESQRFQEGLLLRDLDLSREQSVLLQEIRREVRSLPRGDGTAANPVEPLAADVSPYLGLRPFGTADTELFYGRETLTDELVARLCASLEPVSPSSGRATGEPETGEVQPAKDSGTAGEGGAAKTPGATAEGQVAKASGTTAEGRVTRIPGTIAVTGASGAGKSSLVQAGLLPAVAAGQLPVRGASKWPRETVKPGADPLGALARALAAAAHTDPVTVARELRTDPESARAYVDQAIRTQAPCLGDAKLLLVIDQFEEVFTLCDNEDDRQAFITALRSLAGTTASESGAVLLIVIRSDYIDQCGEYPELTAMIEGDRFPVRSMDEPELRRAIEQPAQRTGIAIEADLTDRILSELRGTSRGPGFGTAALPLLSHVMSELWENSDKRTFTEQGYGELGGIALSVQRSAEAIFEGLTEVQRATSESLFRRLVLITKSGDLARRKLKPSAYEDLEEADEVIAAFTAKRLLVAAEDGVEIAHDYLLTRWPRMTQWVAADRDQLALRSQLEADANEWEQRERDRSYLYRGIRLREVKEASEGAWKADPERFLPVNELERDFIVQSKIYEDLKARNRKLWSFGLAIFAVVSLIGTLISVLSLQEVSDQRDQLLARELIASSAEAGATDGELARLLAATAWKLNPDAGAAALRGSYDNTRGGTIAELESDVSYMEYSPDGQHLVTIDSGSAVNVWDTDSWNTPVQLPTSAWGYSVEIVDKLAFSQNRSVVAVVEGASIKFWDLADGEQVGVEIAFPGEAVIEATALNHDASKLALTIRDYLDEETTVHVFDTSTGEELGSFEVRGDIQGEIPGLGFTEDGTSVMAGSEDDNGMPELIQYNPAADTTEPIPTDFDFTLGRIDDFASEAWLSVSIVGGTWLVSKERSDDELKFLAGLEWPSAFLSGGEHIMGFIGSDGSDIGKWNLNTGRLEKRLSGIECGQETCARAIRPDGESVLVADGREIIQLDQSLTSPNHTNASASAGMSGYQYHSGLSLPGGSAILTATDQGVSRWPTDSSAMEGGSPESLTSEEASMLENSSDGDWAAAASPTSDGVDLINVAEPANTVSLPVEGRIEDLAFSEDGSTLAVSSSQSDDEAERARHEVRVWDVGNAELLATHSIESEVEFVTVAFAGEMLFVSYAGAVELRDPFTGEIAARNDLADHVDAARYFAEDDRIVMRTDDAIRTWDLATNTLEVLTDISGTRGDSRIEPAAFSADGDYIASLTENYQDIDVRDSRTGKLLHTLRASSEVYDLAFSPDGSTLYTFGTHLEQWDVTVLSNPYKAVCSRVERQLTEAEWEEYLPELDYGSVEVC